MWEKELAAARHAAGLASARILELYSAFEAVNNPPASITTEADRASQEVILGYLSRMFPEDAFAAEEATEGLGELRREGRRLWIIDPIDGTRGFAVKNGEFSVMVALAVEGEPVVGVVAEPALRRETWASKGGGCWREGGARCQVRPCATVEDAVLIESRSKAGAAASPAARALGPRRVDQAYSAGLKLARVARGEADVYVNDYPGFSDWDIAAGEILVTEAGGIVSGLKGEMLRYGKPGNAQRSGLAASAAQLHGEVLRRLHGVFT
jgi:3'(2'), 5'-bisphosphate nucleotidase